MEWWNGEMDASSTLLMHVGNRNSGRNLYHGEMKF